MKKIPKPSIDEIIRNGDIEEITEALNEMSAFEISDLITRKQGNEQAIIFGALSTPVALTTFDYLPLRVQRKLLAELPSMQAAHILKTLSPSHRTEFLQELPRESIDELVKLLPNEERILTLSLLGYPEGSIGRLMIPNYISVKMDWTMEQALNHIRSYGQASETLNVIYVVDEEGKLLDDMKITEFLFAPAHSKIKEHIDNKFVALSVYDNDETAIDTFRKHNREALPVIDDEQILLGIVTIEDILRFSKKEASKDLQKIGGMQALNEPYMEVPFFELMKKRALLLIVFFTGSSLTGVVLSHFREELSKGIILVFSLPLVISISANTGFQTSALIISAITMGDIKISDWWKVIRREILSGLFLGVLFAILGSLRLIAIDSIFNTYGELWLYLTTVIFFTILCVVTFGTVFGALLPLIVYRLGYDPAIASGPFIGSALSVSAIVIYLYIAFFFFKGILW